MFWPFTVTGARGTAVQTAGETRFVVDCKINREKGLAGRGAGVPGLAVFKGIG